MTYKEKRDSLDWALETLNQVKAKLEVAESLIAAVKTSVMLSKGDDAKAGSLIRQLLMEKRDERR